MRLPRSTPPRRSAIKLLLGWHSAKVRVVAGSVSATIDRAINHPRRLLFGEVAFGNGGVNSSFAGVSPNLGEVSSADSFCRSNLRQRFTFGNASVEITAANASSALANAVVHWHMHDIKVGVHVLRHHSLARQPIAPRPYPPMP